MATKKEDVKLHSLYDGKVEMVFNPNSPRYRYTVTDPDNGKYAESVRGVTTVLRDIIAKPDLMAWPMNMSHQKIFGAKFSEAESKYVYTEKEALIKTTSVLSAESLQAIMEAGAKAHRDRGDRGKDIGTMVHKACEIYLKENDRTVALQAGLEEAGGPVAKPDATALRKAFEAFADWWDALPEKEVISTEAAVYSRTLNYAGTADLVARIAGKVYMLDFKTTNASTKAPLGIYSEYFAQLGAYSYAVREEKGIAFDDVGIIRIGKDGKLCIATAVDMGLTVEACEQAFAFAVRLHDWLEQTDKWLKDAHFTSHLNRLAEGR